MPQSRKSETKFGVVGGSDQPIESAPATELITNSTRELGETDNAAPNRVDNNELVDNTGNSETETDAQAIEESPEETTIDFSEYEYVLADDGPGELVEVSTRLVKKPGEEYFFVDPRLEMRKKMALCEVKAGYNIEFYGVSRAVQEELGRRKVHLYEIRVCYGKDTGLFLWALRAANPVFVSEWHRTQWNIADEAEGAWLMMEPNEAQTAYAKRVSQAKPPWKPPVLTKRPVDELIANALKDRWINDSNHVLLKQRRGEL
jgi:hypothetical protein